MPTNKYAMEKHVLTYVDAKQLLETIALEMELELEGKEKQEEFYFEPLWHCFQQYEIVLHHLRLRNNKFEIVPKLIERVQESGPFQYDMVERRYIRLLIRYCRNCIAFIETLPSSEIEMENMVAKAAPSIKALESLSQSELNHTVSTILDHFKTLIEQNGGWKLIWASESQHENESRVQQLFFLVALWICQKNNIDISPETSHGVGSVDFKFSAGSALKHLIEFKLSDNPHLESGYSSQLEAYRRSESANNATYAVVLVHDLSALKRAALEDLSIAGQNNSKLVFIDARRQPSASLRR